MEEGRYLYRKVCENIMGGGRSEEVKYGGGESMWG